MNEEKSKLAEMDADEVRKLIQLFWLVSKEVAVLRGQTSLLLEALEVARAKNPKFFLELGLDLQKIQMDAWHDFLKMAENIYPAFAARIDNRPDDAI